MDKKEVLLQLGMPLVPYIRESELREILDDYVDLEFTENPSNVAKSVKKASRKLPLPSIIIFAVLAFLLIMRAIAVIFRITHNEYLWFHITPETSQLYNMIYSLMLPIMIVALWKAISGTAITKLNLIMDRQINAKIIPGIANYLLIIPIPLFMISLIVSFDNFEGHWISKFLRIDQAGPLVAFYIESIVILSLISLIFYIYQIIKKGEIEWFISAISSVTTFFYSVALIGVLKNVVDPETSMPNMIIAHIPILVGIATQCIFFFYLKRIQKKDGE